MSEKKRGRKSKYETHVKPHLEKIKEYVSHGATEKEIADALNISQSVFYDYKKQYKELADACSNSRMKIVFEARKRLIRRAFGYSYEETKKYITRDKDTGKEVIRIETTTKWQPEDVSALAMILRNFSDDWRDKDNAYYENQTEELELKKKLADEKCF